MKKFISTILLSIIALTVFTSAASAATVYVRGYSASTCYANAKVRLWRVNSDGSRVEYSTRYMKYRNSQGYYYADWSDVRANAKWIAKAYFVSGNTDWTSYFYTNWFSGTGVVYDPFCE